MAKAPMIFLTVSFLVSESPSNVKYGMTNGVEQQCKAQAQGPLLLSNESRASRAAPLRLVTKVEQRPSAV